MKRIFRMLIFSGLALYITSLWNKGFIISNNPKEFVITALAVASILYLIVPISKVILLPLNLLTLGFMSTILTIGLFYLLQHNFSLIKVDSWIFGGIKLWQLSIPKMEIAYISNLAISSFSISVIINTLERLL